MVTVTFIRTEEISEKITELFTSERQKLSELFPDADIEHVGGTSIPRSISKGDLDINVRVASKDFDETIKIFTTLYEINQPENWAEGYASFKDDSRELGIQVTIVGSLGDFFVAQREYLKDHPEAVSELNMLKEKFEGKDMNEYRKAKGAFFEKLNTHIFNQKNSIE